jgi:L-seryl-tRNA(Ser) seleniumtransferase
MIARPLAAIQRRGGDLGGPLCRRWHWGEVVDGRSTVGGGSLPGTSLPTALVAIDHADVGGLARRLRLGQPAVVGRIQDGRLLIDPRTVLPDQVDTLLRTLVGTARTA